MLNEPTIEEMLEKLGTNTHPVGRFALCSVVAQRARQIIERDKDLPPDKKTYSSELSAACEEIATGKVIISER